MNLKRVDGLLLAVLLTANAVTVIFIISSLPRLAWAAFPGENGKIAFASNRDGNYEIYVMNADGSDQTRLTFNEADDQAPSWSSDGSRIVFCSNRDGNYEIYVMNADGSGQTRLTFNEADDVDPVWSPNGKKVAFVRGRYVVHIYVMNADGSDETMLTPDLPPSNAQCPAWSPDGSKIVFTRESNRDTSSRYRSNDIWIMNADGSHPSELSYVRALNFYPDYAPDGRRIAFVSADELGVIELYVMNSDGSQPARLTSFRVRSYGLSFDWSVAWSPDGSKIAFNGGDELEGHGEDEIYVINVDGSGQTRLTFNRARDIDPDWQPLRRNPSLTLFPPQIDGLKATIDGIMTAGRIGAAITRISWDWGDGSMEDDWFPASHTYRSPGTYVIRVTCYQSDGRSTTRETIVSIYPPEIAVSDPEIDGLTVGIRGYATPKMPNATIVQIHWDWGDGLSEKHEFPGSHQYSTSGTYTITITVLQSGGLSTTKSLTITVTAPPIIEPSLLVILLLLSMVILAVLARSTKAKRAPTLACTRCGTTLAPSASYCGSCGFKIKGAPEYLETCSRCGGSLPFDAKFCGICGSRLERSPF